MTPPVGHHKRVYDATGVACFICLGSQHPQDLPALAQALEGSVQVSDVLPQLVAMGGVCFQIVRAVMQLLMLALQGLTGANQSLMLVFEAIVHRERRGKRDPSDAVAYRLLLVQTATYCRCVGGRVSLLIASMAVVIAQLALYMFNAPAGISYVVSIGLGIAIFVWLDRKRRRRVPQSSHPRNGGG